MDRLVQVTGELVSFETTHDFVGTGGPVRSESTLRFMGRQALLDHLTSG